MVQICGTEFRFGADPEGFLWDERKGRFVSAYGIIPGTKRAPAPVDFLHGVKIQVDGMALEFNTPALSYFSDVGFTSSKFMHGIANKLKTEWGFPELKAIFQPTAEFDEEVWESTPPEAKILGCDPDFNAWTGKKNRLPPADNKRYRTGAGHIHIGWTSGQVVDKNMKKVAAEVTKELDATLGVASVIWDNDTKRRTLYGKAGAFRPKPYGVEYRTLSNAWVEKPSIHTYINHYLNTALRNLMENKRIASKDVAEIINKNKVGDAEAWLVEHKLPLPPRSA